MKRILAAILALTLTVSVFSQAAPSAPLYLGVVVDVRNFGTAMTDAPIQAAINSLPSTGGVVQLWYGTYVLSNAIYVLNRSNVYIKGMGEGATFVTSTGLLGSSNTGICVKWGNFLFDSTTTIPIRNCGLSDMAISTGSGNYSQNQKLVLIGLVNGFTLERCAIYGGYWEAVFATSAPQPNEVSPTNIRYIDNYIGNTGLGEQFSFQGNGTANPTDITGIIIRGNTFDSFPGIAIHATADAVTITDNYFQDIADYNIDLGEGPGNYWGWLVANNVFENPGTTAIKAQSDVSTAPSARGILIAHNVITNVGYGLTSVCNGIALRGNGVIDDNIISGCATTQGHSIDIQKPANMAAGSVHTVYIKNNVIAPTGDSQAFQTGISIDNTLAYGNGTTVWMSGNVVNNVTPGQYALIVGSNASNLFPNVHLSGDILDGKILLRKGTASGGANADGSLNDTPIWGNNTASSETVSLQNNWVYNNAYYLTGATPSVAGGTLFAEYNSVATNVTSFTNGIPGQTITVIFKDNNSMLTETGNLLLRSSTVNPAINATMSLVFDGKHWLQVAP